MQVMPSDCKYKSLLAPIFTRKYYVKSIRKKIVYEFCKCSYPYSLNVSW
jgi:hypothetical protein